ncbi:hypothetical protein [Fodinicola feengrottensis]|uniref:hypothetical protein n=1 Tax=Fodinicola feengrottensis TaxID=435914 RepID=UPI0013D32FCE|nr:hypothetical protein [Fodinicola feengrottensis]
MVNVPALVCTAAPDPLPRTASPRTSTVPPRLTSAGPSAPTSSTPPCSRSAMMLMSRSTSTFS